MEQLVKRLEVAMEDCQIGTSQLKAEESSLRERGEELRGLERAVAAEESRLGVRLENIEAARVAKAMASVEKLVGADYGAWMRDVEIGLIEPGRFLHDMEASRVCSINCRIWTYNPRFYSLLHLEGSPPLAGLPLEHNPLPANPADPANHLHSKIDPTLRELPLPPSLLPLCRLLVSAPLRGGESILLY